MHLCFSDNSNIEVTFNNNSLGIFFAKCYKHLSTLSIPFKSWDNPYYNDTITYQGLVNGLVGYGDQLSVTVDPHICLQQNQEYFNYIHKIYEKNYDGNPKWLDFHEHIHLCESYHNVKKTKSLTIDYREKAGPLNKPMQEEWLRDTVTLVKKGQIFTAFSELGKTPYDYWVQHEPTDVSRMCELAKPWLTLRPKMLIALTDVDRLEDVQTDEFNHWWESRQSQWLDHWNLKEWKIENMRGVGIVGQVSDIELLICNLKNHIVPERFVNL